MTITKKHIYYAIAAVSVLAIILSVGVGLQGTISTEGGDVDNTREATVTNGDGNMTGFSAGGDIKLGND